MSITNDVLGVMERGEYYSNISLTNNLIDNFNQYNMLDENELKKKVASCLNRNFRGGYLECMKADDKTPSKFLYKLKNPNNTDHQNIVLIANDAESIAGNDEFLNDMFDTKSLINCEVEVFEEYCDKIKYINNFENMNAYTNERDVLWLKALWLTGGRGTSLRNVKRKDVKNETIEITKKLGSEIRTRELFVGTDFISELNDFCKKWNFSKNKTIFSSNHLHHKIKSRYNLDGEMDFSTKGVRYGNELFLKELGVSDYVIQWRQGFFVPNEKNIMNSDKDQMELIIEYMMESWN